MHILFVIRPLIINGKRLHFSVGLRFGIGLGLGYDLGYWLQDRVKLKVSFTLQLIFTFQIKMNLIIHGLSPRDMEAAVPRCARHSRPWRCSRFATVGSATFS